MFLDGKGCELSILSQLKSHDLTGTSSSSLGCVLRRIFVGEHGLRTGWSALLFVTIYLILDTIATAALSHFVALDPKAPIPFKFGFLQEFCELLVVFLATWAMARIESRQLFSFGYTGQHRFVRLVSGVLWGLLALFTVIAVLWE